MAIEWLACGEVRECTVATSGQVDQAGRQERGLKLVERESWSKHAARPHHVDEHLLAHTAVLDHRSAT